MSKKDSSTPTYTIGAVSRLTGLTTHNIRMWEHRYSAVTPDRTSNGRRVYNTGDVEKLSMLKALTDRGITISSITALSAAALRERLEQDRSLGKVAAQQTTNVAIMGATIPALLRDVTGRVPDIEVVATSFEPDELKTSITGHPLDILILELPVLNRHTIKLIEDLRKQYHSPGVIVVYRFGRSTDVAGLAAAGIMSLRSPVDTAELVAAIHMHKMIRATVGGPSRKTPGRDSLKRQARHASAPPRRYDRTQLARLADIETSVDCECPHHLAEILSVLSAFEEYSRNCEETDDAQGELHAYLHNASGRARIVMEEALAYLCDVERIAI